MFLSCDYLLKIKYENSEVETISLKLPTVDTLLIRSSKLENSVIRETDILVPNTKRKAILILYHSY